MMDYTDQIVKLIRHNLKKRIADNISDLENEPLLGKRLNLTPQELGYLLMEVEKEFHIAFSEEYILKNGLKTIGDFSRYIQSHINK